MSVAPVACSEPPVPVPVELGRRSAPHRAPGSPHVHPFSSSVGHHVLIPDGSRVYDLDAAVYDELCSLVASDDPTVRTRLEELGLADRDHIGRGSSAAPPPVRYLSLAVAQQCNLGCTYCYADGGDFGGEPRNMSMAVALATVDRLIDDAEPGDRIGIAFMGGEPLANRSVVHEITAHVARRARALEIDATFSITTNATMLEPADLELFRSFGFAVTVSIDGVGEIHDRLRPSRSGAGTYDRILARITPLLECAGHAQVTARITVTPDNLDLVATVAGLLDLGFHAVGCAPALVTPSGASQLGSSDLTELLEALMACGREFVDHLDRGERFAFTNVTSALQLIHRGAHRPYPCGAGAAYLGVDADGSFAACHRFVGSDHGRMGDSDEGWDDQRRGGWLDERHVDRQEPCRTCWARYLCGGGCHHEVIEGGRHACDFVRGWLDHCLGLYAAVSTRHPEWFARDELTFR